MTSLALRWLFDYIVNFFAISLLALAIWTGMSWWAESALFLFENLTTYLMVLMPISAALAAFRPFRRSF